VPQLGALRIATELGVIDAEPGEIASSHAASSFASICPSAPRALRRENYGPPFRLPELGTIGANGLANARDFSHRWPRRRSRRRFRIIANSRAIVDRRDRSLPARRGRMHGNYAPYKYDLARFNCINTVSFDHPDPSIYTVLTALNCDFAIFRRGAGGRAYVSPALVSSEHLQRIHGTESAALTTPRPRLLPAARACTTHVGHGPDAETSTRQQRELKPQYLADTLAFMFETRLVRVPRATPWSRAYCSTNTTSAGRA